MCGKEIMADELKELGKRAHRENLPMRVGFIFNDFYLKKSDQETLEGLKSGRGSISFNL